MPVGPHVSHHREANAEAHHADEQQEHFTTVANEKDGREDVWYGRHQTFQNHKLGKRTVALLGLGLD